jgi:hypothetical protein
MVQFEICQAELVEADEILCMKSAFDKLRLTIINLKKFKLIHYSRIGLVFTDLFTVLY